MTASKTVGYFLFGVFVIWFLIGSGTGIKYSKNILTMAKLYPAPPSVPMTSHLPWVPYT